MIPDGERLRDALLHGAPEVVAEPRAHVAHPGGDDASHAARPHELVEEHVRDGAHQGEVAPPLSDQLVAGGEEDERLQRRAHADRGAIGDEAGDGLPMDMSLARGTCSSYPGCPRSQSPRSNAVRRRIRITLPGEAARSLARAAVLSQRLAT